MSPEADAEGLFVIRNPCRGRENPWSKFFEKIFEKPIDKSVDMVYN